MNWAYSRTGVENPLRWCRGQLGQRRELGLMDRRPEMGQLLSSITESICPDGNLQAGGREKLAYDSANS